MILKINWDTARKVESTVADESMVEFFGLQFGLHSATQHYAVLGFLSENKWMTDEP